MKANAVEGRTLDWAPWPRYEEAEIEAVARVLRSGKVNQWTGEEVVAFENDYASYLSRNHAVALMNGTVALELAMVALGIRPGDEVITTPRTFIASASASVLHGATPIFADVDRDSGNITAETIQRVLTPRTKAIVVVHLAGWPADMRPIMDLASEHGIVVIEDCAQAHGAISNGRRVGSFGHAAAFSFCQDKIITTMGEGGLLALDDEDAWRAAWSYKDHGKSFSAVFEREHPPGFRWVHETFGTNWRMLEAQAVVGRLQLARLDEMVKMRNRNARVYRESLSGLDALRMPEVREGDVHAHYKLYAYMESAALRPTWNRDRIMLELTGMGVPVTTGSCSEIYLEKAFTSRGFGPGQRLPVARELGETALMFQVHPNLERSMVETAADMVRSVVLRATR